MTDPIQFGLAVLLLLAMPGPTNAVIAAAAAVDPAASPWRYLAAAVAGYLAIVFGARLVLLPLIDLYPPLGIALRLAVAAWLVVATVLLWRTPLRPGGARQVSASLVFATTVLNPKGLVFAIAVLPRESPVLAAYFAAFAALILVVGWGWFMAGRTIGLLAGRRAALLPRAGAAALLGFAAYLAVTPAG